MRKLLLPFLLLSQPVYAEEVACNTLELVHDVLANKHGEKPFIEMVNSDGKRSIIYLNPETKTYTILYFNSDKNIACMADSGDSLQPARLGLDKLAK